MEDDLERFVVAQAPHIEAAKAELAAGRKRTHWMWFVFPQWRGLGRSQMARHFGLASATEARDYLAHPLLGPRLRECVGIVLAVPELSALAIFGSPDDLKLRSCLTLFRAIDTPGSVFDRALERFFAGRPDPQTLQLLAGER
jgi:uncharacterized protein (DUF1810 family)